MQCLGAGLEGSGFLATALLSSAGAARSCHIGEVHVQAQAQLLVLTCWFSSSLSVIQHWQVPVASNPHCAAECWNRGSH